MVVLIVEDETAAARQLGNMLSKLRPRWQIAGMTESISETVQWLTNNPLPDIILMDIQLSDGECFAIFEQIEIHTPVIFTTAFDEYAIRAFKVNSIDYLLKPIEEEELAQALVKYESLHHMPSMNAQLTKLMQHLASPVNTRERMLFRTHNGIKSIECSDIAYIKAQDKHLYVYTFNGEMNITDQSLDELAQSLSARLFFRINRKYLCHIKALQQIRILSNSRVHVMLTHCKDEDIFVSQSRISDFRQWLDT
ncbi:LytR/AlgR family response regulator transcription factor [Chitinophaga flava]|uniref:DNA-binding response regulator n=1 Tax=Chitinophaga flava TaxID=2259036 RepID=A0A365XU61_9BACT|nr:LytTR family DNA-binding domain-containing protein [Chitinophaga flava]RBL89916.1 DNA-binding response regulator [Chitinophaga flava]